MKGETASFFTYQGPGRISIARWAPRRHPAGYRVFAALAPRRNTMKMSFEEYNTCYFRDIVGRLDPRRIYDELHQLAGDAEPVLLCWEKLPLLVPDNWCHRRYVAEWFGDKLGIEVPEVAI